MPGPIDHLLRLQTLAEQSGDGELAAWLSDGVACFLFEGIALERALELNADGRGKDTARRSYLLHCRDAALRAAWALCEGATPWRQSVALSAEIRRFQSTIWPRWQHLAVPPENASDLRRHLYHAHRCGDVPTSTRQCHRIAVLMSQDGG